MAVPFSELQAVAPSAVIELFVLELNAAQHGVNATYRFHAGTSLNANGELVWAGNNYQRFPIEADGFEYSGNGQLPRPKLRVSNILGYVTALLAELPSGLQGAKVTRIRTLARYLDAVNFPVRRNLLTDTNLFAWTETGTTPGPQVRYRQANAALAPDGTMTATKLVSSTDNDNQRIFRSTTGVIANSPVTYSFYAKAGEYTKVSIRTTAIATANAIFDLINGVWIINSNATSQFAVEAGNGWYRIGITYAPTGTSTVPWVQLVNNLNQVTFTGDGTSGVFLWGAQLEVGDVVTGYQPVGASFSQNPYGTPDATAEFPQEIYYIDRKSTETREVVEFELAAAFDLQGVRAPKRQCISSICQWKYRSAECGYAGSIYYDANDVVVASLSLDVCGKRLSSCEARFAPIVQTGSVVSGSNVLTITSSQQIALNDPVRGPGVPASTTVSAILTGTTVRMSSNATLTTSVTTNGTPSTTASTMTVTSAAGLGVGMTATGQYMNGATITAIAGTTLTLSQRPYSFTRDGTYSYFRFGGFPEGPITTEISVGMTDVSGIVSGMRVFGSNGVDTTVTLVGPNFIELSSYGVLPQSNGSVPVTLFFLPSTIGALSYTFSAGTTYTFRDPDKALPFGSFPGVGAYRQ